MVESDFMFSEDMAKFEYTTLVENANVGRILVYETAKCGHLYYDASTIENTLNAFISIARILDSEYSFERYLEDTIKNEPRYPGYDVGDIDSLPHGLRDSAKNVLNKYKNSISDWEYLMDLYTSMVHGLKNNNGIIVYRCLQSRRINARFWFSNVTIA